jgi:hypothetical protein
MTMARERPLRLAHILHLAPMLLALACGIAPASAHDVSREIAALQERVKELQAEELVLQSQIREVGGSSTTSGGIAGAEWRIRYDQQQIAKLEDVAALYRRSTAEMQELTRQFENSPLVTVSDLAEEGAEETAEKAAKAVLEASGKQVAKRTLGIAMIVGDVVEYGGRKIIREVDEHRLRQQAIAEQIHLNDVLATILMLQREVSAETVRIQQLRELQTPRRANFDALATTRQQIAALVNHTHDTPQPASAVGEAPKPKPRSGGVRLCDPSQRHQPIGVRQAQKTSRAAATTDKEKPPPTKTGETFALGDACVDITGLWTMQQTIQILGKKAPGPQLRAEIVRADSGAVDTDSPRYELFGPNQATAKNGPLMRCTRTGYQLACQRRVQQQACPPGKYVWAPLDLTIASDVSSISGDLRQTWLMDPRNDPSGCTVVEGGQGTIGFRLLPAKP